MITTIQRLFVSFMLVGVGGVVANGEDHPIFSQVSTNDLSGATSDETPLRWSYSDCLDWAIAHNTDIRQTLLSILQADEDIAQAKDAWLPSVDFSTGQGFTNYPLAMSGRKSNTYNSSYGVNASWTVWEGNARKYRLESSKLVKRQQQLAGEDQIKELQVAILQAYLNILYSREAIEIAKSTLEVSTAQTERMRKLVEGGRQSNLSSYKMNLKKLLNLGLENDINIVDVAFPDSEVTSELIPMASAYESALGWLPAFKSNQIEAEIYAKDVDIARTGNAPNISLQGGIGTGYATGGRDWGYQMGHGLNENIGLSLSVPIYDGNKTKRAVAKAKLAQFEADINREKLLNDLAQTIENLYIDANNAQARYRSGMVQLEAMEETSTLVNRQFELGLVNPLDLLTAHNNLLNARLEQLQNKYMAILASKTITFYASGEVEMP